MAAIEEIGKVYFTPALGHFLVWDVLPAEHKVDVYICGSGDLGRLNLESFRDGVRRGTITLETEVAQIARCPKCRCGLELVRNGTINGSRAPFIACRACAFCEEL